MILHTASRSRRLGFPGMASTDRTAAALGRRLDDGYHWFRSLAPGGIEVIDAIVVGPGGTWTITMAGERGRFARRNGHWYRWNRSTESWVPWDANPITASRLAGRRLSLFLEHAGLPAVVEPILLPPTAMEVTVDDRETFGLTVEPDPDRVAGLVSAEDRLSQGQVDRIVALLDPRQPLPRLAQATPNG
ncbi:MAG: nuclease-related domain-containing protein [Candidatus Limnocylindria bacterium]